MSLLFNMLSKLLIDFLSKNKHLLISWLQSLSVVILELKKIKSVMVSIVSPSICHEVMGVWVNSGRWWWTGRPGMLRFMGWQRVGHDWVTELNWTETILKSLLNLLQYCFCFIFWFFWPGGMWDLSSPTRNQIHVPCIGRWSLNHWIARQVPLFVLLFF